MKNKQTDSMLIRLLQPLAGRFPLRLVFSLPFMVQFVLAVFLIGLLLFQGGQVSVKAVMAELRVEVLERVHEHLSSRISEPLRTNRISASYWQAGLLNFTDTTERDRFVVNQLRPYPDVAMLFAGFPDGSFYGARRKRDGEIQVVHNNRSTGGASWYYKTSEFGDAVERQDIFPNFDPRTRPWYQAATELRGPTFSKVYKHFVFQEPTITAAHPIYDSEGNLAGVLGVDYLLSGIGAMLRELPVGSSGQVFITDHEGMIVAASAMGDLFEQRDGQTNGIKAADSTNEILQAAVRSKPEGTYRTGWEFTQGGHSYFVDTRSFVESGIEWTIFVVLAADDYLGGLQSVAHNTAIVASMILAVVFGLALWTSGWVTEPIRRLNWMAKELTAGRFEPVAGIERHDELGQLTRSFNMMGQQLTDLVMNLEAKVAERTQDLAAKTQQEQKQRELYQKELTKAGRVQRAMIPPDMENSRVAMRVIYEPNLLVSGDTCGYYWLTEDVLFGYIVDVSGHGVATGLQTAAVNVMLRKIVREEGSLVARLTALNQQVLQYFDDDTLVAALFFEVDFAKKVLRYSAAGITEFFAASVALQGRQHTPGSLLGVSEQPVFEMITVPIQAGDQFCFYSDGLAACLQQGHELPLEGSFTAVVGQLRAIGAEGACRDDVTALCLQIKHEEKLEYYYVDS